MIYNIDKLGETLVEIGCLANFNFPYKSEIDFAIKNNFKLVQIWYDNKGISLLKDLDPLKSIQENNFPSIIHALLDINEFEIHIPKLLEILVTLGHKELIIHPVCKSELFTNSTILKLSKKVQYAYNILDPRGITLYIENNSKLDPLFNNPEEVRLLFLNNPNVKFLLDIAHTDSYENLNDMINAKFPDMLHVADKHFNITHEHLPIGDGELDFNYIFKNIMKKFNGKIILEIIQSKDDIISSRDKLEKVLQ